jgi:membrane fusion protein, heavy metal efflux system
VGITTASVQRREITRTLECNAELLFNGDRFSHISPRASGVVQRVEKRLGDLVEAGEVLAVIDSADLGNAKAELLQAQAAVNLWQQNYDRQRQLTESGIAAQRELLDAQTRLTEANIALSRAAQRLRNLGVAADRIDEIKQSGETTSLLPVTAPFGGIVVDRHAVQGEVVDSNHVLFSIADTSLVWAMLDVYEPDVFAVALGQPVTLHLSGLPGQPVAGRITWISPQLDPQTRTLKVRAEVENSDGRLRANMFGRATIVVRDREPMLVVPREALQWEGCCNVVFVQRSESEFQPRKVRVGHEVNGWSVIEEGLEPDEAVVVQGSFLLKTEILKANIGAGCCAED